MQEAVKNIKKTVEQAILKMDPRIKKDWKSYVAACVTAASAMVGPCADRIAKVMGLKRRQVREVARNCRKGGLWVGRKIRADDWWDKEAGGAAFWCDVGVARGWLAKTEVKP